MTDTPNSGPHGQGAACPGRRAFLDSLKPVQPRRIQAGMGAADLVDGAFFGHNARSLRDACEVFTRFAAEDTTIAVSLSGALVPAGAGPSCLIPLIEAGLIDWMVSTGANLYHDLHDLLGYQMKVSPGAWDDTWYREEGVIRIHNLVFDQDALFDTDRWIRDRLGEYVAAQGADTISSAQLHRYLGERALEIAPDAAERSVLAAAARYDVPVFVPAVNDSSIGMNVAALLLRGAPLRFDTFRDVNESTAIVYAAKKSGGKSAVLILGGGAPKNFLLQTEPHIQEVLGLDEAGHDYFIQLTDARVDTGGLSGATPSEAMTWGKVDPDQLQHTAVCYGDCAIHLPLLTAYALERAQPRPHKRLYARLDELTDQLRADYAARGRRDRGAE